MQPAYQLTCLFLAEDDEVFVEAVSEVIKKPECFNTAQQEPVPNTPSMYAIAFEDEGLQDIPGPSRVKQFWASEADDEQALLVIGQLDRVNKLDTIWHLARDSRNLTAIKHIKENFNSDRLLALSTPSKYIDDYDWCDEEFRKQLALKLINSGSMKSITEEAIQRPYIYRSVIKIFLATKDEKAYELAKEASEKASKEDWSSDFNDGDPILTGIVGPQGSASYKDAFIEHCKNLIIGSEKLSNFINNFNQIKEKVIDKNIVFKLLAKNYFQRGEDSLSDESFVVLREIFKDHMDCVPESDICLFVDNWLRDKKVSRLEWFSSILKGQNLKATDSIKDRLVTNLSISHEEHKVLVERLMAIFSLKKALENSAETQLKGES